MHPIRSVDNYLISKDNDRTRVPGRYLASDAGSCKRRLYFMYNNLEASDPLDPHTLRKLGYGRKIEEQEIEWLYASGVAIDDHVKFNKPNPEALSTVIAGEIDVLCEQDSKYIVEIKTGYGYGFKSDVLKGRPNTKHLLQGMIYLDLSPYDDLVFTYIDRGTCDRREHHLQLNEGIPVLNGIQLPGPNISIIYKVFAKLHKFIKNNILPPPDFIQEYTTEHVNTLRQESKLSTSKYNQWKEGQTIGDWECEGCVFRSLCADS